MPENCPACSQQMPTDGAQHFCPTLPVISITDADYRQASVTADGSRYVLTRSSEGVAVEEWDEESNSPLSAFFIPSALIDALAKYRSMKP